MRSEVKCLHLAAGDVAAIPVGMQEATPCGTWRMALCVVSALVERDWQTAP